MTNITSSSPQSDADAMQSYASTKIQKAKEAAALPPVEDAPNGEHRYQHYTASRKAFRMVTEQGGTINFADFQYITRDPVHIAYLDQQIDLGRAGITKGECLTTKEADPQEILRKKHIEEYLQEQEAIKVANATGKSANMGNTKKPGEAAINPMSSKGVASAGQSSS